MLSQVSADFFARSPVLLLPVLALCLFGVVFVAISVRAMLTRSDELQRQADLPLQDDEVSHG